ncbi:MAG: YjgN family protein [Candidatus Manganitrophus sp.]|nr:YjgN family protein [Candidatus Manganitrophus sp.]WDT72911.1 MAG: YjgN family protein [Candidatus Manganitrophus sp.]WDT79574.1 MAG: YjgN family protein [Candidatus Manganitrophus sp.]
MTGSMRCAKCGLTQLARSACKACGTPMAAGASILPSEPRSMVANPIKREEASKSEATETGVNAGGTGSLHPLSFHGTGGALFSIRTINMFLTLITLGFYHFWGKVRVRKYLWGQTEFNGDRFAYHGTGKELFIGFLKSAVVFGLLYTLFQAVPFVPGGLTAKIGVLLLAYGLLLTFIPLAMVGARRYRLSRTSWRGIRFSFRGEVSGFIKLFVGGTLLSLVTLGLYYPIFMVNRYGFMVSHSYFGSKKWNFNGRGRDLWGSFLVAVLLSIFTLGLYWFWFLGKKQRYLWEHTTFGPTRFRASMTGGGLLLLNLGNMFLLLITLGLAWPWVVIRNIRYTLSHLTLEGPLDLALVQQESQSASATGEGLGGLLNLDSDFGAA